MKEYEQMIMLMEEYKLLNHSRRWEKREPSVTWTLSLPGQGVYKVKRLEDPVICSEAPVYDPTGASWWNIKSIRVYAWLCIMRRNGIGTEFSESENFLRNESSSSFWSTGCINRKCCSGHIGLGTTSTSTTRPTSTSFRTSMKLKAAILEMVLSPQ